MSLKFEIQMDALARVPLFLNDVQSKALPKANRNALNRSLTTLRNEINNRVRLNYKLKKSDLNKKYLFNLKARGNMVSQQVATLNVSGKAISLINFVPKAKRKPVNQRGIPVKRRRPLRIEIRPGDKRKTKLFVQKGKGGNLHVFRRNEDAKKPKGLMKQSAPSLPELFDKVKSIRLQSSKEALKTYRKEFDRQFDFFVKKAEGRLK